MVTDLVIIHVGMGVPWLNPGTYWRRSWMMPKCFLVNEYCKFVEKIIIELLINLVEKD